MEERVRSLSGLNTGGYSESSKNFNKSVLVGGSHTYAMGMLKLKDNDLRSSRIEEEDPNWNTINLNNLNTAKTTAVHTNNSSVRNLLESKPTTSAGKTASPTHVTHTNSKTILHQAYLQALKQSSSMQDLTR